MPVIFTLLIIPLAALCGYGEGVCSSHSECAGLASATSDRRYCCGGNFCCTRQQWDMGITEDPFTSLSIPGIVGIVAGVLGFLSVFAILLYCLLKASNKRSLNRPPRNSRLEVDSTSGQRYEASSARPGRAVPVRKSTPDYAYPPDAFDGVEPRRPPPPYPHKKQTIPTVIGTYDGLLEYSEKRNKARYAYDGPAAYDSDESEFRHHSRRKDHSFDSVYRDRDRYRGNEDSHDRRYRRDVNSRNRRYYRDKHPYDRRYHEDKYSGNHRYREDDYPFDQRYGRSCDRRY